MPGEDPKGDHEGSNAVAGTRSEAIAVARREEGADPPRRKNGLPSREDVWKPRKVGAGGNASPHYFGGAPVSGCRPCPCGTLPLRQPPLAAPCPCAPCPCGTLPLRHPDPAAPDPAAPVPAVPASHRQTGALPLAAYRRGSGHAFTFWRHIRTCPGDTQLPPCRQPHGDTYLPVPGTREYVSPIPPFPHAMCPRSPRSPHRPRRAGRAGGQARLRAPPLARDERCRAASVCRRSRLVSASTREERRCGLR
jgi:hypothetical protein